MGMIVKTTFLRDCGYGHIGLGQKPAGALDPDLKKILVGGGPQKLPECAFQLPKGEPALTGEIFRVQRLFTVPVQMVHRRRQFPYRVRLASQVIHAAGKPGNANDSTQSVSERNFVGNHQIRGTLGFRRRFDSIENGQTRTKDLLVILDVFLRPAFGKKIEVCFADCLAFRSDAAVIATASVQSLEAAGPVLDEERDIGQHAQQGD
jgi:hypothetical protein